VSEVISPPLKFSFPFGDTNGHIVWCLGILGLYTKRVC